MIDMPDDFLYGTVKCERCQEIIGGDGKSLSYARKNHIPVIYMCDSHKPDDGDFEKWHPHAVEGTPGAEVMDELKPMNDDYVMKKPGTSLSLRQNLIRC